MTARQLAYRETGSGRPLILLHGFMGTGSGWLDRGPADTLAAHGFRLVLPDLRGHGDSARSHDPLAYPPDVLADDGLALIEHLGLGPGQYDLGGYSLGGRIVVRMLARGAEPGRAVVAGQGLEKVSGPQGGGASRRALTALVDGVVLEPGSPDAKMAQWAAATGADPRALLCFSPRSSPRPRTPCGASRPRRWSRSATGTSGPTPTSWPRGCPPGATSASPVATGTCSQRPSSARR